jgi:hypothetical protein
MVMEILCVRLFGLAWIGMVVFLSLIIASGHSKSGVAVGFILFSAAQTYCHFSGIYNPPSTQHV